MSLTKDLFDSVYGKLSTDATLLTYVKAFYSDEPVANPITPFVSLMAGDGGLERVTVAGPNGHDFQTWNFVVGFAHISHDNASARNMVWQLRDDVLKVVRFERFKNYGGNTEEFYEPVRVLNISVGMGARPFSWAGIIEIQGRQRYPRQG